jgi:transporter family protein
MPMVILSAVAGATSWLFYFKALQVADASRVAPIDKLSMPLAILLAVLFLGERPSGVNWLGIALIAGGAYLATLQAAR